jgi:hypothetical protein
VQLQARPALITAIPCAPLLSVPSPQARQRARWASQRRLVSLNTIVIADARLLAIKFSSVSGDSSKLLPYWIIELHLFFFHSLLPPQHPK